MKDFEVGDFVTSEVTLGTVIYRIEKVEGKKVFISSQRGDGTFSPRWHDAFSSSLFQFAGQKFTQADVTYYEAITERTTSENQVQS